jgi:hypothetical protein
MLSPLTAAGFVIILLAALYLMARGLIYFFAQKEAIVVRRGEPGTPADAGLEYEQFFIPSRSRSLEAWWVKAAPSHDTRKAILIYHGTNETISEWIPALQVLAQHGISAFIFDYSGFGHSTGRATFRTLTEDAIAARGLFEQKAGPAVDKYLLGLSLGSGVLLEGHARLTPGTCGVILVAAFTSLRDVALAWKLVPAPLAHLAPNIYNNLRLIRSVRAPLLLVHSRRDDLFPLSMPKQLYAAANEPKALILLDGLKHNDMLEGKHAEYLAPIIHYMKAD